MVCSFAHIKNSFSRQVFFALFWCGGFISGIVLFPLISHFNDTMYQLSGFARPSLFGTLISAVFPVVLSSFFVIYRKYLFAGITIFLKALSYGFVMITLWHTFKGSFSSSFFVFLLLQSCSCILMLFSCMYLYRIRSAFKTAFFVSVTVALFLLSLIYHFCMIA